jgi:hypothetical protein
VEVEEGEVRHAGERVNVGRGGKGRKDRVKGGGPVRKGQMPLGQGHERPGHGPEDGVKVPYAPRAEDGHAGDGAQDAGPYVCFPFHGAHRIYFIMT